MKCYSIDNEKLLPRIANHLIINSSFIENLGLFHGKMGIVIFFLHYYKHSGKKIYLNFANELIEEIYDETHAEIPVNLESGIVGIGWGLKYLIKDGILSKDHYRVLKEIDRKIMERDLKRITDFSLRTGFEGISLYLNQSIQISKQYRLKLHFDKDYLSTWKTITNEDVKYDDNKILISLISSGEPKGEDITQWPLGLERGCAGKGLKFLLS